MKQRIRVFVDKRLRASAFSCFLIFVLLVIPAFLFLLPHTKSWFASNKLVGTSGITLSADSANMHFADTFTVTASLYDETIDSRMYRRDPSVDQNYYLCDTEGSYVPDANGKKQSLFFDALPI